MLYIDITYYGTECNYLWAALGCDMHTVHVTTQLFNWSKQQGLKPEVF